MSVEHTTTPQHPAAQDAAARADVAARVREAVEHARLADQAAREGAREAQRAAQEAAREARIEAQAAVREARAEAHAEAVAEGIALQPAPENVTVRDGQVIVRDRDGNVVREIMIPGQRGLPPDFPQDMPPRVQETVLMFFVTLAVIAIGIPLARAFGRWLDRRGQRPPAVPADVTARLQRIEEVVETVALEVERISEGQRFTSRLMAEMRQAPQLEGTRIPEPRR